MDFLEQSTANPAAPRLTTYTEAGRMELSGATVANWQAKVANLLVTLEVESGDAISISATPSWLPVCLVLGAWRIGARVIQPATAGDHTESAAAYFTDSLTNAQGLLATVTEEIFVLPTDLFGLGAGTAKGSYPFGISDFASEIRTQPDAFLGAEPREMSPELGIMRTWAQDIIATHQLGAAPRVCLPAWQDVTGLQRCASLLLAGGSVVMSSESSQQQLEELAARENAVLLHGVV